MYRVVAIMIGVVGLSACSTYDNPNSVLAGPTLPPGLQGDAANRETVLLNEDGERVVCRTEPVVGSRIGNRICHTEEEWEEIERNREHLDDYSVSQPLPSPF